MTIPELVRRSAEREVRGLCEQRVPTHLRDEVRLEVGVRGVAITILELGRDGEVTTLREYALQEFERKGAKVWADQACSSLR